MQRPSQKSTLYLDQNWISNITKAYAGIGKSNERSYFYELSIAIRRGVAENRLGCPTSGFHRSEAFPSSKNRQALWYIAEWLSNGLSFRSFSEITYDQLLFTALEFAGMRLPEIPWWQVPFNKDPYLSMSLPGDSPWPESIRDMVGERDRKVRDSVIGPAYRRYKESRKSQRLTYEEELEFGMRQLFKEGYTMQWEAVLEASAVTPEWEGVYQDAMWRSAIHYRALEQICEHQGGIQHFLISPQFAKTPSLSVRAKLMAADIVRYPNRTPEASLSDDFSIVSTVVPYVDILATENYVAELLKQTRVAQEYGCRVFTMRQKDELLDLLKRL